MNIAFTKDGKNYDLGLDGSVKRDGTAFGTWTTDDNNALAITAKADGAVFQQPARWSTKANRLSVKPDDGSAVEFIEASDGDIQFRLKDNVLFVDPLPTEDDFAFALHGDWAISDDYSALELRLADGTALAFKGGLNDSQSRFAWTFEAGTDALTKRFTLRFEGAWKLKNRGAAETGLLASFAFEYQHKDETSKDTFELPVEMTADAANGNRLMFSYKSGAGTTWKVAFAGRFSTKGGAIIGYSAEVYDDAGKIASRFTFDFKGRIKDGSAATRNSLQFVATVAGQKVELTLSGSFAFAKSNLTFSLKLNTATKTGETPSISFGVKYTSGDNTTVQLGLTVDGSVITVSLKVGTDIKLGGSRKGSVYATWDMKVAGDSVGIDAMFGITLN